MLNFLARFQQNKAKKERPDVKLKSSQFRLLNEFLYTNDSKTSQQYFEKRADDFKTVRIFSLVITA